LRRVGLGREERLNQAMRDSVLNRQHSVMSSSGDATPMRCYAYERLNNV